MMHEAAAPKDIDVHKPDGPRIPARVSRFDLILWVVVSLIVSGSISVVRWPTYLGISALPWLHKGIEYPWRVWWRARTQYVNAGRHLPLYLVMGGALAIVFIGTTMICWLLLTHSSDDPDAPVEGRI